MFGIVAEIAQRNLRRQALAQRVHGMLAEYRIIADPDENQRAVYLLKVDLHAFNGLVKGMHDNSFHLQQRQDIRVDIEPGELIVLV